jgi:NhaC family Na+:H+ antiporter
MARRPTLVEAFIPVVAMLLLLGVGIGILKLPIQALLLIAAFITFLLGKRLGLKWDQMMKGITDKISSSMLSVLVMICVGALIASWMVSGTSPLMIYYGIKLINPRFLLVTAFLVTCIVSTFTGTSFGSAGTVGVAIMGVAQALGVPLPAAAGAVISGSVFGDKLSPFSDTTILAPIAAGCDLYDHIKHMLWTTGGSTIVCLIVYAIAGLTMPVNTGATAETATQMLAALDSMYNFNVLLLLPALLVLVGAILKKPIIPMLLGASVVALILGMIFQGFTLKGSLDAMVSGFRVTMVPSLAKDAQVLPQVATLLNRGGMMGMMGIVLLVICSCAYAGIVSITGCTETILEALRKGIRSVGTLITSTALSGILMSVISGSSYLAILIPGEMFRDMFDKWGLERKNLSRTLEDAGTCVVPLVPWATAGIYMANTLGVPTASYFPWAILCYSACIFAVIFGFTGIGIAKLKNDKT